MRFLLVVFAVLTLGIFTSETFAAAKQTVSKADVVRICGDKLGGGGAECVDAYVMGCEVPCGDKICTFNCCAGSQCPGGQGCWGQAIRKNL